MYCYYFYFTTYDNGNYGIVGKGTIIRPRFIPLRCAPGIGVLRQFQGGKDAGRPGPHDDHVIFCLAHYLLLKTARMCAGLHPIVTRLPQTLKFELTLTTPPFRVILRLSPSPLGKPLYSATSEVAGPG